MINSFNGLRVLATLGIFFFHSGYLKGAFPVTFFFMLSGFLSCYTLYDKNYNGLEKIKWFMKRLIKFYPIHLITFLLSIFIRWNSISEMTIKEFISKAVLNLCLIQSLFQNDAMNFNGLSWFLSVLMIITVFTFILLKIVKCFNIRFIPWVAFFIIFTENVLNITNQLKLTQLYLYSNPAYRVLDILIGMLIARLYIENRKKKLYFTKVSANAIEFIIVILFFIQYIISYKLPENIAYYSLLFSISLYVFAFQEGKVSKILSSDFFKKLSEYTFEFYMIHELILIIFRKVFYNVEVGYLVKCTIIAIPSFLISIILAYLFHKYISARVNLNYKNTTELKI